jgi:MFS family permease
LFASAVSFLGSALFHFDLVVEERQVRPDQPILQHTIEFVGLLEGVAEATASIGKIFSGTLSDRWRRRKPLVVLGYGLAALSKPAFPLADSVAWVFAARFADRVGKVRGRAILSSPTSLPRFAGPPFRQASTVGAVVGPGWRCPMWWLADDIRAVLWFAVAGVPWRWRCSRGRASPRLTR